VDGTELQILTLVQATRDGLGNHVGSSVASHDATTYSERHALHPSTCSGIIFTPVSDASDRFNATQRCVVERPSASVQNGKVTECQIWVGGR
jgi:hypothetical protein